MAIGCDTEKRISRLERQTEELKAEVGKNRTVADYDLQAKCSQDAKVWFSENYSNDNKTLLLNHTNHYNKSLNKCFVAVENHYSLWGNLANGAWVKSATIWDVYENSKYGELAENHMISNSTEFKALLLVCEVLDKKCSTAEEFNALVRPYFNN